MLCRFPSVITVTLLLVFTAGCMSVHMNVKSYSDPEVSYVGYKSFAVAPIDKENPLLEKELLHMIKQKLISKGYKSDPENPDFLVALQYYVGPFQYYEAPTTLYLPQYTSGESTSHHGMVGNTFYSGSSHTSGKWESKPMTYGGGSRTAYYRKMIVSVVDAKALKGTNEVKVLWRGDVDSSGSSSDIRAVAPFLIDEMMDDFPITTSRATSRSRSMDMGPPQWMEATK